MFTSALHSLEARGIRVALDLEHGQLARFEVFRDGRRIAPFARVPWAEDTNRLPPDTPPHLRRMSGDFFCAPFGRDDREGAPLHGWPANAPWDLVEDRALRDRRTARFRLSRTVSGATVEKIWTLRDDHPCLYQRHEFHGGTGMIPVAHHAMIDLRTGGKLRFSPKLRAETPEEPLEPGRSALRYPASATDLTRFPGLHGPVDLTSWPIGRRHEDFVMLIDDPAQTIGWATATRPAHADLAFLLKPVATLPQTLLWFSNGGRDRAPWDGQHVGVLGIEDACSFGGAGWTGSIAPNRLSAEGIPTALDLGAAPTVAVPVILGAFPTLATEGVVPRIEPEGIGFPDGAGAPIDWSWLGPT